MASVTRTPSIFGQSESARSKRLQPRALALAAAALLGPWAATPAVAASCTWNTTSGNWNALANWLACATGNGNPAGVPGAADSATIGAAGVVAVTNAQVINALANAGTIDVANGGSLRLNAGGGGTVNSGMINMANGGVINYDGRVGPHAISGGGSFVLGGASSRIFMEGAGTTTLAAGSTIRGAGQMGQATLQAGAMSFVNAGTVSADVNGGTLLLLAPANGGSYTNNALFEARNGGTLQINAAVAQGGSGSLQAMNGSTVLLGGIGVSGGTLGSEGSGAVRASNSSANLLSNVTLAGVVDLASAASQLRVGNNLSFSGGTINVGGGSNLFIDNRDNNGLAVNQSLSGTGSITVAGGNIRFETNNPAQTTLGSGVSITGWGNLGQAIIQAGQHTLVNNGLISANSSGNTLVLQPISNGSVPVQNNGILEATGGGTLQLNTGVAGASGSQLRAGTGSTILLNGVTVSGTVNVVGAGALRASNNGANLLNNVTLTGTVDLASAVSQLRVGNDLTFSGGSTVQVGGSTLFFDNRDNAGLAVNQSLSGTGSITVAGGNVRFETNNPAQTTLGSGVSITGWGNLGQAAIQAGQHTLVNNGLISANSSGNTLVLQPISNGSVPIQNNGVLEATGGGTLRLDTGVVGAAGSQLRAGAGSTIVMNGVTVSGEVNTSGSGKVTASNNNANLLRNATLNGAIDLSGPAAQLRIGDNLLLQNNASIVVGASTLFLDNRDNVGLSATQSVTGSGNITLAGGHIRMEANNPAQTTLGSGVSISGFGTLGQPVIQAGDYSFVNASTVSANVNGQTLRLLRPGNSGSFINQAVLEARNGGILELATAISQTTSGSVQTLDGSTVQISNVSVSGGTLSSSGTGVFRASNIVSNLLSHVTLSGVVDLASVASQLRIGNGLAFDGGTIDVGGSTLYLDNRDNQGLSTNQTLSGTGNINLAGGGIRMEANNPALTTIAGGVTIAGHGNIGQAALQAGTYAVVNHGTIAANTAGQTLTLNPFASGGGGLSGTGRLQVAGGTLSLATGQASSQGILDIGAAGTLATNNRDLTLSIDYTNAQAGSGNSFNRRAGITGTGQILAAANAAQVLSGTQVTGGNTAIATLTIGNVRVGSTNFGYTVGNSGSTGPTLRGALQTNVNGANLTDTRLSGSGVTAGNYNAGAPAGSGETRTVTFTANSAGTLAPLTGQVLNLRSNFDNIADQKLNIVLGSGAAAYNAAVGNAATPVQVANQRVGGSNSAALSITNTAAAGPFSEDLRVTFGANTGAAGNNAGSVNGLLAGATNNAAMRASVNTATAGAQSGTVSLNYETLGSVNGVSNGLGTAPVGGQQVTVNGNVYQLAAGALQTPALNFGTVQVGQSVQQALVIRNTAAGAAGFVEDLNASFGATSGTGAGLISGVGSFSGILAGTNSAAANGNMLVSVNTAGAGVVNGSIAINYTSAGAVGGVSNGLGTLAVGSEAFGVQGSIQTTANVINQASPQVNNSVVNLGAVRVGAAAPSGTVSVTNVATVAPQAALNASISATSGPINASGTFNLLNPGSTNASSLSASLNTGAAGNFTGANAGKATITFVSDANNVGNCAPDCQLNLASQVVDVAGKVYQPAVGSTPTTALNFGVVRVGDTVSAKNIVINNTAAVAGLNDTLRADLAGASGAFTGGGSVNGVAAQGSGNIAVGLNTSTAGIFNANGSVAFTSQNPDMADVSAGANAAAIFSATVNNLANGDFNFVSGNGALSRTGTNYLLDLGNVNVGQALAALLSFGNNVAGPADELSGGFDITGVDDFSLLAAWSNPIANLAVGNSVGGLGLNWTPGSLGLFTDTLVFSGLGTNASDTIGLAQTRTLQIRANVVPTGPTPIPEPSTFALLAAAAAAAFASRVGRRARSRVGISNPPAYKSAA